MNLFRVRGIQLAVHFSFFLLVAINAYSGWADDGGMSGLLWHTAALLAFFVCVVLHELGHSFMAMHYGIRVRRILLMPIGGMAEFDEIPREPRRELLVTLAGPAVNFAIAALLWTALPRDNGTADDPMTLLSFGHVLLYWNLLMGTFNLLPAFPMDGGRILRALLATRLSYLRATFWAATVGKVVSGAGLAVAVYLSHPMLMLLFGFIFFAGELEYRAVKRRERDEAELQAALATFDVLQPPMLEPPIEEPPLLRR